LLLLCLCVFLLNGCVSIISKCHQANDQLEIIRDFEAVSSTAFVMYSGLGKFVLSSVALLLCKKEKSVISFNSKTSLLVILGAAAIGGVSYMLQLIGAETLPATVLYPLVTGGCIVFSSLSGLIFFREKLSVYQIISIILCFIGTLLFL
jgi:multidrug transporter EmrE-like cation transporter